MSFTTPTKRGLKRTKSQLSLICNSSDTEEAWTPPRKRFRFTKDEDSPTFKTLTRRDASSSPASSSSSLPSSSPVGTPSKRRKSSYLSGWLVTGLLNLLLPGRRQASLCDLTAVLGRCGSSCVPIDTATITDVKDFPRGENEAISAVKQVLYRVKLSVKAKFDKAGERIMATELYLEWLQELDFVLTAIENLLSSKVPGTRKRVSGLGRISFTILYQLIDEFISEVDLHHDGWSYRSPGFSARSSLYPETMTIVEESHDSSTDVRIELAVREAEDFLARYDSVMADAVRRYKIECGRSNVNLADAIGSKEHSLSRACCLLCEQTGYGSNDNDTGDTLLQETRAAMQEWKAEFGSGDHENESDELTSD
ncbi:hypothetical protein FA15DRAFT_669640 [Coprinopsis marcescibilis]|uniref:Uncharacterized protein n=1 Tax=Coprinopsis marcescibilis TaxID=230819 RepID=A0A5C3KVP4_COPMA|nr:hypothetical protein FA15DRAFT_669640 [Coprinopsis marcescibilis]